MRINVADQIRLGGQAVSRVYLGPSLIWTSDPALDLVFDGRALDPRMTFSRPSIGTRYDSSGILLTADVDQPRYDHDPLTLALRGLLVEEQRTNDYLNSNPSGPYWLKTGGVQTTNNALTSPAGVIDASRFVNPSGVGAYAQIRRDPAPAVVAGMTYTRSGFVKSLGMGSISLLTYSNGYASSITVVVNLINNTFSQSRNGQFFSDIVVQVFPLKNEWLRFAITYKALNSETTHKHENYTSILGNGVNGYSLYGLQSESGSIVTSHIPTTGTARTRAADSALLTPQGWLSAEKGAFVLQHDVPAGRPLLGNGSAALLNSAGPGKTAFRYDGSGAIVVHNGGAPQAATFPSFAASLQLLGAGSARANAAVSRLTYFPRRLTVQELQGMTA